MKKYIDKNIYLIHIYVYYVLNEEIRPNFNFTTIAT